MTRKRYVKLGYALMQKINKQHIEVCGCSAEQWGKVLAGIKKVKFGTEREPKFKSYAEAWESLKPVRQLYGM